MLDVLAYCSDIHVWTPGVRFAAELAASFDATLTGIHVSPSWPAREPTGAPPSLMAELVAHAQEEMRSAMQADGRFAAWARGLGVRSVNWHVALGDPAEVLGVAGNWNDVIVIDRRIGDRDDTTELLCEMLLSGFVCIAVPDNGYALTRFDRVAVAFDGSPACIRALHAAGPLLQRAMRVVLIETERELDTDDTAPAPRFDPKRYLTDRGVDFDVAHLNLECITRAEAILEIASKNRTDLLVAGAPGKRGLGDCRLHATASHLLNYAGTPILMAQ